MSEHDEHVEALAKVLWDHVSGDAERERVNGEWIWARRCECEWLGLSEAHIDHVSEALLDSPAMRDLLAAERAKARAEGAAIGFRAALDPGSFVKRGSAELAGEPFTERMDQWQRRAMDEGLARADRIHRADPEETR